MTSITQQPSTAHDTQQTPSQTPAQVDLSSNNPTHTHAVPLTLSSEPPLSPPTPSTLGAMETSSTDRPLAVTDQQQQQHLLPAPPPMSSQSVSARTSLTHIGNDHDASTRHPATVSEEQGGSGQGQAPSNNDSFTLLRVEQELTEQIPTEELPSSSTPQVQAPALITSVSEDQRQNEVSSQPANTAVAGAVTTTPSTGGGADPAVPQTPQTYITFLLISGRRKTMSFPPETTIGRVKELAWNSWPADWQDERPPAPAFLRVLYLGRMLQDDETLTNLKLPTHLPLPTPSNPNATPPSTIMHLSIRPSGSGAPEDGMMKKRRRRQTEDNTDGTGEGSNEAGCCGSCVIC